MPNRIELWRAAWPAGLVGVSWLSTGVANLYPAPLAALVAALMFISILWPSRAPAIGVYLSLFAVLLRFPQPLALVLGGIALWLILTWCLARAGLFKNMPADSLLISTAFAIALALATLSGGAGSAVGWEQLFRTWFNLTPQQADLAVKVVRKCIHFSFYGSLALTMALASWKSAKPMPKSLLIGTIWSAGHGAFDELRQSLTPGRTGSPADFAVDMVGAAAFLSVFFVLQRKKP